MLSSVAVLLFFGARVIVLVVSSLEGYQAPAQEGWREGTQKLFVYAEPPHDIQTRTLNI